MKTWVAVHHHRFGVSVFSFDFEPTEDQVIAVIDTNGGGYEPDREEYIDIECGPVLSQLDVDIAIKTKAEQDEENAQENQGESA